MSEASEPTISSVAELLSLLKSKDESLLKLGMLCILPVQETS